MAKTGSKKHYRRHRAYVWRDHRRYEEAKKELAEAEQHHASLQGRIPSNHLDPLLDENLDNIAILISSSHERLSDAWEEYRDADNAFDLSIVGFDRVCSETGITPREVL